MYGFGFLFQSSSNWQKAAIEEQEMWAAASEVIWLRGWQMLTGTMTSHEATRMLVEKPLAFARAAQDAGEAVVTGRDPVAVTRAAVGPLRSEARANARRLRS
ncbi:antifreeze protein [Tropicimonas sp. TH_r6]|uniref:antifreeze protein n=1 Tax=Tropicimonas sp. TH_r6 TaxID=3082085 RepID=UPI0029546783|nr:antifreeze protein [Tropicimonas sp. TH_r6]MDV7144540.1 antifreeze protein [Tropicimonas sp. TH_r6]